MSDSSYVIDIAANMPDGEATTAQLDQLVKGLTGGGKGADFFQQAIKQVSASLDAAKAAASASNASLAEGVAKFRELEKAANIATKAEEKMIKAGKFDPATVTTALQAKAALDSYSGTLKSLEQNASAAAKQEASLSKQLENVKKLSSHTDKSFSSNSEKLSKLTSGLNAFGNPLGGTIAKVTGAAKGFEELSGAFGTSNAAAIAAAAGVATLVVAVVALSAALVAGVLAVANWAVGLADAKRSADLHSEAVRAMSPELDGLRGTFADVTAATGLQADALEALAKKLQDAKTPADAMAGALSDAALQEAALGAGGADKFIAGIAASKGAVTGLANSTRLALGGIVAKQLRGLDAQSANAKRNFSSLFSGLNIEPVLAGFERLGALFDQTTVAGQTMKFLFESVFQPLINQAEKASVVIESFALGFLIGLTKLYIGLKPTIKALSEFFGFDDPSLTDTLNLARQAGELIVPIVVGFAAALAVVVGAIGLVVAGVVAATVALYQMVAGVISTAAAVGGAFLDAFTAVRAYLAGLPAALKQVGIDLMLGLASGITGGVSNVVAAMTGAVGSAIDAAKKKLGIASPSKVFAEIGGYAGEGFAKGVDDSAPDAQAAMSGMVDPGPAAQAAQPSAGASSSGGPMLHIENLYLAGAKASEADKVSLAEALTKILKGDVAQLGGEPAPA